MNNPTHAPTPGRVRLQFGIRALLVLVTVSGVWFGATVPRARNQDAAAKALKAAGNHVSFDHELDEDGKRRRLADNEDPGPAAPRWLRERVGDAYFQDVVQVRLVEKSPAEAAEYLQHLPALESLYLSRTNIQDTGMVHLRGLSRLRKLEIWFVDGVTDAGLVELAGLRRLTSLSIIRTGTTDAALAPIGRLPRLETLNYQGNATVTDAALAHLAGCRSLEVLRIGSYANHYGSSEITDAGLVHLRGLTRLEVLDLSDANITDAGLVHLRGLTRLKRLDLSGTRVTGPGLVHLQGLRGLESLNLADTEITDAGLDPIRMLTALEGVALCGTSVSDAGFGPLAALPNLTRATFTRDQISVENQRSLLNQGITLSIRPY